MFGFIKELIEHRKMLKQRDISFKKIKIKNAVLKYFEDLQGATGKVDLPAFVKTQDVMARFVKTDKDVIRIYRNLQKA